MRPAALLALALIGCTVEPEVPDSSCDCALDFSDHPRNDALQAVVDDRVARGLPGLSVAVRTPEGVWAGAAGYADLEHEIPMTPCHVHHMASIAKTWYAAVAVMLQDDGVLDLDAPLADYLPPATIDRIANADVATVRQVMSHTSGIPDFTNDVSYVLGELNDPTRPNDPMDLLDAVRGRPALAEPGAEYHYADTNYVLIALLIDGLTGDAVGALQDAVIDPLGLEATTFYVRDAPEPACICNTYWEVGAERLENVSDMSREYATQDVGADGLAATPLDGLTFVEALVRGDLLSEEALAQMTAFTAASEDDEGYGYGLGIARRMPADGEMWGHTGGSVGTGAVMRAAPHRDTGFVAATNVGMFLGGPLAEVFDESIWDDLVAAGAIPSDP